MRTFGVRTSGDRTEPSALEPDGCSGSQTFDRTSNERRGVRTSVGSPPHLGGGANTKHRESGDPNSQKVGPQQRSDEGEKPEDSGSSVPSAMRVDDPIPPGYLDIPALVSRTGVDERWLKSMCKQDKLPYRKIRCRVGRAGWKYVLSADLADRIRLMYIRKRRIAANTEARAIHRNGRYYHHNGTVSQPR